VSYLQVTLQTASSKPSVHSCVPLHAQTFGIQSPLPQRNSGQGVVTRGVVTVVGMVAVVVAAVVVVCAVWLTQPNSSIRRQAFE